MADDYYTRFGLRALVVLVVLFLLMMAAFTVSWVDADGDRIAVRGAFYGYSVDRSDIAQVDTLSRDEVAGLVKRNGGDMAGYRIGWFTDRDGERVFVRSTPSGNLVRIKPADGAALIVNASVVPTCWSRADGLGRSKMSTLRELTSLPGQTPPRASFFAQP